MRESEGSEGLGVVEGIGVVETFRGGESRE